MRKIKKVETANEGNRLVGKFVYEEQQQNGDPFDSILKPEDLRPVSKEKETVIKNQIAASMIEYYNRVFERATAAGSTEVLIHLADWANNHLTISTVNRELNEDVFDEFLDRLKGLGYSLTIVDSGIWFVSWESKEKK